VSDDHHRGRRPEGKKSAPTEKLLGISAASLGSSRLRSRLFQGGPKQAYQHGRPAKPQAGLRFWQPDSWANAGVLACPSCLLPPCHPAGGTASASTWASRRIGWPSERPLKGEEVESSEHVEGGHAAVEAHRTEQGEALKGLARISVLAPEAAKEGLR